MKTKDLLMGLGLGLGGSALFGGNAAQFASPLMALWKRRGGQPGPQSDADAQAVAQQGPAPIGTGAVFNGQFDNVPAPMAPQGPALRSPMMQRGRGMLRR